MDALLQPRPRAIVTSCQDSFALRSKIRNCSAPDALRRKWIAGGAFFWTHVVRLCLMGGGRSLDIRSPSLNRVRHGTAFYSLIGFLEILLRLAADVS